MGMLIHCPDCQRELNVPDEFQGKRVKCPACGATFTAGREAGEQAASGDRPLDDILPTGRRSDRRDQEEWDDDEEEDYQPRRSRYRADQEPHRGVLILIFGILSLVTMVWPFGLAAWIMGHQDLAKIRTGRMDPLGEGMTNAGMICGIIGTIIGALGSCCCVSWYAFVASIITAGAR